jgi:SET domain-containing protein
MKLSVTERRRLEIKEARNGRGIFLKSSLTPEKIIFEVTGEFITCNEDDEVDDETRSNAFPFDEERYISPKGRIGDFLNHSCDPNAKLVKKREKLYVMSLRTVAAGKEVFIDYSTILANNDIWKMKCNCGSEKCRRVVKRFSSLPEKIKRSYLRRDMVPNYILE